MTTEIYLDCNATTPVLPTAAEAAMQAMQQGFGNPSSTHATGLRAKAMLAAVRERAQGLLGVGDGRLMFNSGATEGIQSAIVSALCALRARRAAGQPVGSLLLYGATEHKAVPESLAHWNQLLGLDLRLRALPVDADGRHDLAVLASLLGDTALLCTMAANNETGIVSDLAGIEAVLQRAGSEAYWLVDCVQALGKLDLNLSATRIDYAPFSGHKLYAPKGIGMLYVRAGTPFTPLLMGGGQEAGLRSGTENLAGVAALGAVLAALQDGQSFASHATQEAWRARLIASLRRAFPAIEFNAPLALALPTTLNFSVPGLASRELLDLFDAAGIRVSSGSACSAAKALPSYVLEAMGLPLWRSSAAIRLSFGPLTGEAVIDAACERIERCGAALRASGLLGAPQAPAGHDGVLQFSDGAHSGWLLTHGASGHCVLIDPPLALVGRLAEYVRNHRYQIRAIVHTNAAAAVPARAALQRALDGHYLGEHADQFGWPDQSALTLGARRLTRAAAALGQAFYLLGEAGEGVAPRLAFIGALDPAALDANLIGPHTLLCRSDDAAGPVCTTLVAERAGATVHQTVLQLGSATLDQFMAQHPEALLIDVREPYEHAAGRQAGPGGRAVRNVPLSHLAGWLGDWLDGPRPPLVFFCRSGNRSGRAAECLHRLGYGQVYHLGGGMALN